jgi:hypothetical protein
MGQKRRDGEDYIRHPERMVFKYIRSISGNREYQPGDIIHISPEQGNMICAIWLHDCIEDAPIEWGMNEFISTVFGYDIWDIVIKLTHDPKLETYNEYISQLFKHEVAWQIKWLDMIDNTSYAIPDKQRTKYKDACIYLMVHGVTVPPILMERLGLSTSLDDNKPQEV